MTWVYWMKAGCQYTKCVKNWDLLVKWYDHKESGWTGCTWCRQQREVVLLRRERRVSHYEDEKKQGTQHTALRDTRSDGKNSRLYTIDDDHLWSVTEICLEPRPKTSSYPDRPELMSRKMFSTPVTGHCHCYFSRLPRIWNYLPTLDPSSSVSSNFLLIKSTFMDKFTSTFDPSQPCTFHFYCPCGKCYLSFNH